jgi:spermidine/putrescine transport system permease protein
LGLFFVIPFYSLISASLFNPKGSPLTGYDMTWHFHNFVSAIDQYHSELWRSLWYAGVATLTCLVVGYVLAYAIAFKAGRWKNLMLVLVIAPFFTSFLLRTLSWKLILADDGKVVSFANWIHLTNVLHFLHLTSTDDRLLATPFAVIAGLTYNFLPFMVLPLYASLEKIDLRLIEAGKDLYADGFTSFRKITLPLSMPGLVAGTLLTFIPAAGDYINAELLGTPRQYMIGNVIDSLFLVQLDYPAAAACSVVLMLAIVVMVLVYVRRAGTEELL